MKLAIRWILKKTGIYNFIWVDFCKQYPIRLSGETPEVKLYLETQHKVITDMMIYGMGCTQYVDPRSVAPLDNMVRH